MISKQLFFLNCDLFGGLAQLARALAWHARGHRFESGILHKVKGLHAPNVFGEEATGSPDSYQDCILHKVKG